MPIVTEQGFADDAWTRDRDGPRRILPLEQLLGLEAATEAELGFALGVDAPNDADPLALKPFFDSLSLVTVAFPNFADGRGFSLGRRLRDLGYRGRLRARGPVIVDQFAYARACGFDEIEIDEAHGLRQPEAMWRANATRRGLRGPRAAAQNAV